MEVEILAGVGVGEIPDIAGEGGFVQEIVKAGTLGGVVVGTIWCWGDGGVAVLDGGVEAAGFGVRGKNGGDVGGELVVFLDVGGDEVIRLIGYVREDEGGRELVVIP